MTSNSVRIAIATDPLNNFTDQFKVQFEIFITSTSFLRRNINKVFGHITSSAPDATWLKTATPTTQTSIQIAVNRKLRYK